MSAEYDFLKRIVIFGPSKSGKSTLMKRATAVDGAVGNWAAKPYEETIGVDFSIRRANRTQFQIWDTAGAARFRTVITSYCRGAEIVTFVCDASDLASFGETQQIFNEMIPHARPEIVVLLVNKMETAVTGAAEASSALGVHMQSEVDKLSSGCSTHVPFVSFEVSVMDPPLLVLKKLGGGHGCLGRDLVWIRNRPGCVRIPAVGQVEAVSHSVDSNANVQTNAFRKDAES